MKLISFTDLTTETLTYNSSPYYYELSPVIMNYLKFKKRLVYSD